MKKNRKNVLTERGIGGNIHKLSVRQNKMNSGLGRLKKKPLAFFQTVIASGQRHEQQSTLDTL